MGWAGVDCGRNTLLFVTGPSLQCRSPSMCVTGPSGHLPCFSGQWAEAGAEHLWGVRIWGVCSTDSVCTAHVPEALCQETVGLRLGPGALGRLGAPLWSRALLPRERGLWPGPPPSCCFCSGEDVCGGGLG